MTTVTQFSQIHVDLQNAVTIPSGQTLSNMFDCGGTQLCGLYVSSPLSDMLLTFDVGNVPPDLIRLSPMYDGATPTPAKVNFTAPTIVGSFDFAYIYISPAVFAGVKYIQIESSDAVASDAIIYLAVRPT